LGIKRQLLFGALAEIASSTRKVFKSDIADQLNSSAAFSCSANSQPIEKPKNLIG